MPAKTNAASRERVTHAAQALGLAEDQISTVSFELKRLRELGVLVDIDIQGISLFSVAATGAEWGIADEDERHKRMRGGVKMLIPEQYIKRLRTVETRLRQITDRYSLDITAFRPYAYILFTAHAAWLAEWGRLVDEWNQVKRDILKRHPEFVTLLARDFAVIADRAWTSLVSQGFDSIQIKGKVYRTKKEFVKYVVERAQAKMPTKAQIEKGLVVGYRTAILADSADLEERLAAQAQAESKRAAAEAQTLKVEMTARQAERFEREQFEERLRAMRQVELENARQRLAEMGSPLSEALAGLRTRIVEQLETMLASIQKNGFVKGKIATQAGGLLEFYDLMAVTSDRELRDKLARLKTAIGPVGKDRTGAAPERDVARITALLEEAIQLGQAEVASAEIDSRFDYVELY